MASTKELVQDSANTNTSNIPNIRLPKESDNIVLAGAHEGNVTMLTLDVSDIPEQAEEVEQSNQRLIDKTTFDAHCVEVGVYVGSVRSTRKVEELAARNITGLINLSQQPCHLEGHPGFSVLNIGVADAATTEMFKYFGRCFDFIEKQKSQGHSVLVYCQQGISRSATIACAYLMSVRHLKWFDALAVVQKARHIVAPNYEFLRQLYVFEASGWSTVRTEKEFAELAKSFDYRQCVVVAAPRTLGSSERDTFLVEEETKDNEEPLQLPPRFSHPSH